MVANRRPIITDPTDWITVLECLEGGRSGSLEFQRNFGPAYPACPALPKALAPGCTSHILLLLVETKDDTGDGHVR
jgi:hypothetical protein